MTESNVKSPMSALRMERDQQWKPKQIYSDSGGLWRGSKTVQRSEMLALCYRFIHPFNILTADYAICLTNVDILALHSTTIADMYPAKSQYAAAANVPLIKSPSLRVPRPV
jgi:hypothetical protein